MSQIASKSVETFVVRTLLQMFTVGAGILIAREMGPAAKGVLSYVGTVVGTIQMLLAGQSAAISWQYGKRGKSAAAVFKAGMQIFVPIVLSITLVIVAVASWVGSQRVLYAAAAALPFMVFTQLTAGFFLADSRVRTVNLQSVFPAVLTTLLYLPLLLVLHESIAYVLAAWVFGFIVAGAYSAWAIVPVLRNTATDPHEPLAGEQIRYGSMIGLNSIVAYLNFRIDVFLVVTMLGQSALGIYSIAISVGELMWQLSRPIATAAFGAVARGSEHEAAVLTAKCMRHSFALATLAAVVLFFAGPPVVTIVYGAQFAQTGMVLRVLLPGIVAYSMMPPLPTFFSQQLGNPRISLGFSTLSMVMCAVLTAILLPRIGLIGGALATSVSYCTAFLFATYYFVRHTKIPVRELFVMSPSDLVPYRYVAVRALQWPLATLRRWGFRTNNS